MKKKVLSIVLAFLLVALFLPMTASAAADTTLTGFAGGNGEATTPYQIGTKDQLANLAAIVNGGKSCKDTYFVLTADIGSSSSPVTTVIGNDLSQFKGHFDGADHTVTLAIDQPSSTYVGLFAALNEGGEIKNVHTAGSVQGFQYVGSICGYNNCSTISGCTNAAAVTGKNSFVGGICGGCGCSTTGYTTVI